MYTVLEAMLYDRYLIAISLGVGEKARICGFCPFPWYKYSHHGWLPNQQDITEHMIGRRRAPNSQATKNPLQSITAERSYDASREFQAVLWGENSPWGVGAAGRGEECRQKRERSLERTTCHFKQFGLHPKVNTEPLNSFKREWPWWE